MDYNDLYNLLDYGISLNIVSNCNLDEYNNKVSNNESLKLNIDNIEYTLDFSDFYSKENERIIKLLQKHMPITTIIDLVTEAIYLGVITDISSDYNLNDLISYEKNYKEIVKRDIFYYKINSELFDDTIYKITFDKKCHDIKNKIEYASRTSLFIDTLMKRIMAKYNILLVRKASFSDDIIPKINLDSNVEIINSEINDSEFETDLIENELKVLINYRDNFNNTTWTENVIDDIFINIDGNNINYGFYNIGQYDESEPIYDVINEEVDINDIDSLLRIRNLINDSNIKFNIFETLRKNEDSNLYSLIKSRINDYDNRLNTDPKIEFTITPLSIYCNHIVKKTCTYKLKSKNRFYSEFEYDYSIQYNPRNLSDIDYFIYGDGDIERLGKDEELILAFSDYYENKDLFMKVTSKKYASCLYNLNSHYRSDRYKDVYFLNESLVKLIDNKLVPFDGVLDEFTYIKSQIVRGEISGKYVYIKDATRIADEDILGVDLLDIDTPRYVSNEYIRKCDICNHQFGATKEAWDLYQKSHILVNDINNRSCCKYCIGNVLDTGNVILYSEGYNEYYLDNPKELKYTDYCSLCNNPNESFIHINNSNNLDRMCKICHMHYCNKHMNKETNICDNCNNKIKNYNTISNDKLIRLIKSNLNIKDIINKELLFNYQKDINSLWVYSKSKKTETTYFLLVSENEKYVHLINKYKRRGEK